jgi:hypothetical protein
MQKMTTWVAVLAALALILSACEDTEKTQGKSLFQLQATKDKEPVPGCESGGVGIPSNPHCEPADENLRPRKIASGNFNCDGKLGLSTLSTSLPVLSAVMGH